MAAYASLVSLSQTIQKIYAIQDYFLLPDRELLDNTQRVLEFFSTILKNDQDDRFDNYFLKYMRDDANDAEDLIEQFMSEQYLLNDNPRLSTNAESEHRPFYALGRMEWKLGHLVLMSKQFLPNDNRMSSTNVGSERHQSYFLRIWEVLPSMENFLCFKLKSSPTNDKSGPSTDVGSEELQDIARSLGYRMEMNSLNQTIPTIGESSPSTSSSSRLAHTNKDVIVGLEDDLMKIKNWLTGESSQLQVIPIVGMGGIGKTTLATNVYNDPLIMQHFDIRVWVKASKKYDAQEFLSSLIISNKSFDKRICERSIDEMDLHVYQTLIGRRYLVVVDDMWSTNEWDLVSHLFSDNHNGSRIILTTRLLDVANYVDPSGDHHHVMHLMDEYQSWNLLQNKVFPAGITCPLELAGTGFKIARSCRGLPLAIVLTAGLLSTVNQDLETWKNIARKISLHGTTEYECIKEILLVSYTNLPHYLRPCLLYMAAFPEEYDIHVSKLVKLCVAEGFLEPVESKSLEEWAEECLENLSRRNLVMVNKRKSNGKTKSYNLHDIVREMCIRKAEEEQFLCTNLTEKSYWYRRVSICSNSDYLGNLDPHTIYRDLGCRVLGKLNPHTIIYIKNGSRLMGTLNYSKLLRVLDAFKAKIDKFPTEVSYLFHLRFLAFSYTTEEIKFCVPVLILRLRNLQTLMVHSDTRSLIQPKSVCLPIEIWKMANLRHLVSFILESLPDPPAETPPLENLQTLSVVADFKCTEEVLLMIPNLKKLGLFYRGRGESWPNYQLNNLANLSQLEKLSITVIDHVGDSRSLLEGFISPTSLKRLTLRGCIIQWEVFGHISWPNLQVLKLRNHACEGDIWKTTEDKFPHLRLLMIETTNLHIWEAESGHFPMLETLLLYGCDRLRKIPEDIGNIMTLELIELDGRNRYVLESANRIQEEQESFGNYGLQVRINRA